MKNLFFKVLLGLDILAILYYCFMTQFVVRVDDYTGIIRDGLGRALSPAPLSFTTYFLGIHEWAGLGWLIVDAIVYFALMALGYLFFTRITKKDNQNQD